MVNQGETVIQVGTPNPSTMKAYSKYVGPNGRVIIIEPEPKNIQTLQQALSKWKYKNVSIVPKGAWSESGKLELSLSPNKGDHKIEIAQIIHDNDLLLENTFEKKILIEVNTVDNIITSEQLEHVDYINITVNGAELEVLQGCQQLLQTPSLRLWIKGHARFKNGEALNKTIQDFLQWYGFTTFITAGEYAVGNNSGWQTRAGDVYAYKL
jgi:FkbM family methyltransferase